MIVTNETDLDKFKIIGKIVANILKQLSADVAPGITTKDLDNRAGILMKDYGVNSAPQVSYNFPGFTCISVNEEVAHGIPSNRILNPGDIVNIDVSAELDGYFGDTGGTFIVPPSTPLKIRLLHASRIALEKSIAIAKPGVKISVIGAVIENTAKSYGFRVIRNLGSHGIGRVLHEDPIIPNYNDGSDIALQENMLITLEPFISSKSFEAIETGDGWTLAGKKGNFSAQFEHTMLITSKGPIILTIPD